MADYNYVNGDGLDVIEIHTPVGATEPVSILHLAIQQIKRYLKDPIAGPINEAVPIGTVFTFAGSIVPARWLLCNGDSYPREGEYATLFQVIGTAYNTDNTPASHFRVPDFSRRVAIGPGGDISRGTQVGEETHQLTVDELPAHAHEILHTDGARPDFENRTGVKSFSNTSVSDPTRRFEEEHELLATTGKDEPHNNMQPSLGINFIIKY